MPTKARAQEDAPQAIEARWLPGAAPWAWHCRPLYRQGHERGVTEDKAFHVLQGIGGSRARALAPDADLLHHQEDSRRSTWVMPVQADTA
jgi:hypothetical protein